VENGKWKIWMVCLIGIAFVLGCASEKAAPPDNFTARMVTMGIGMPMAKMGEKSRFENPMLSGIVTISSAGSGKVIMMSTTGRAYFEQARKEEAPSIYDPDVVIEKTKTGSETIDGHSCVKYDVVMYRKDKPDEKYRGRAWEAGDLGGLTIRHEMDVPEKEGMAGGVMVMELKDVKLGAATADMFTVPEDYRKVNSMMELMAGAGGAPAMPDVEKMKEMMKNLQTE
jgi:hypothetical protein